jgi:hypothetical protein
MKFIKLPEIALNEKEIKLADKTFLLMLIEGEDDNGEPKYAYLGIKAAVWDSLRQAIKSGKKINLGQFGKIFRHGSGVPTEENKEYMKNNYFFNHNQINAGILN